MADTSLPDIVGPLIELDHVNDIRNALRVDFMGRNAAGAATAGQNLGTSSVPWGTVFTSNLNVGGRLIDFDNIGTGDSNNAVISGATRTLSGQPDFIRCAGSGNGLTADILATTTSLTYTANATSVTISADVTISGLTAAPTTNNTCLINDTSYSGGNSTKYEGESTSSITIDTAGSEITARVGQYVALKASSEIMLAYVQSSTEIRNCFRGFFFDESGDPIVREVLSDNDTLTLMSLGWVFGESNGTIFDVTYRSPYVQYDEPSSPVTDDYWYDITNGVWKRYNGSNFVTINRTFLGWVVSDGSDCIASRSVDFSKSFSEFIAMEIDQTPPSVTQIQTAAGWNKISVYGQTITYETGPVIWDITAHLESGLTEASATLYYLYITENGDTVISDERPYNRRSDLRGFYHPYHSWRFVGVAYNDGSSDFSSANSKNNDQPKVEVFTSSGEYLPLPNSDSAKVTLTGGGGGGGGASGSAADGASGGTSSFGTIISATGGTGGQNGSSNTFGGVTNGGTASGGDLNINGGKSLGGCGDSATDDGKGGDGGASYWGGGGPGGVGSQNGYDATVFGTGGGGAADNQSSAFYSGSGGGAGATVIKYISNISQRISVTIGSGGAGGNATITDGGAGADGVCIVEY